MTRKTSPTLEDSTSFWPRNGREVAVDSRVQSRRVVRVTGDMTDCEQIRRLSLKCARAIGVGGQMIIIDLAGVDQADTKLMACLVSVIQLARSSNVAVQLRTSRAVNQLAEFCRLSWLIEQSPAPEAA